MANVKTKNSSDNSASEVENKNEEVINQEQVKPSQDIVKAEEKNSSGEVLAGSGADIFSEYAGAGLENVTVKDLIIPRYTILQSLSPQVKENKPEYNPDAKPSDFCDTSTQEILSKPLLVIPVHFEKTWIEWAPRSSGKGIQKVHTTDSILSECEVDDKGKAVLPNKNYIVETMQFYILDLINRRKAFIALSSTQLKKGRRWLTLANGERLTNRNGVEYNPPIFYRTYNLSTVPESNAEGDWHGWKIERSQAIDQLENWQNVCREAIEFREGILAGTTSADLSSLAEPVSVGSSSTRDDGQRM